MEPVLNIPICPKCGNDEIQGKALASGFTYVNMKTLEIEIPDEVDCDFFDIDEFICGKCEHEWDDPSNSQARYNYNEEQRKDFYERK